MNVQSFDKKRLRERERERDGKLQSGIKEVKVIYMPYDYNFILTLTLTWFDRLSIILSVKAFLYLSGTNYDCLQSYFS